MQGRGEGAGAGAGGGCGSQWQSEEARCAAVLREVFAWLGARELARCGAACRAWRRAAAEPALWRRQLLRAGAAPRALAALRDRPAPEGVQWREEAVRALAGWRAAARLPAGAPLLHAALAPHAPLTLALAAADASLAVWQRKNDSEGEGEERDRWRELWRMELRGRGWASVARAQWARSGRRLLLAGPLALADDWELLVLDVHDEGGCSGASVASRVRCSAGAAGCWAGDGDSFLSLRLSLLAPALACTTVWLNAATQETQSEYAGVCTPLLRIFNENGEHITHALVADVPLDAEEGRAEPQVGDEDEPGPAYHRAAAPAGERAGAWCVLLAGGGRALGAWALGALRPPPLLAGAPGELAERARRRRERGAPPPPPPPPDAAAVRALCTPPLRACRLAAPLAGLVVHDSGRCVWATLGDGSAECRALASLRVLRRVLAPGARAPRPDAHYVQPDVSPHYFASPARAYSSSVWTWSVSAAAAPQRLQHAAPAAAALLPRAAPAAPERALLLVLAGDLLHVWRSRATPQPRD